MATETEIEEAKRRTDGAIGYADEQIRQYLDQGNSVFDFARLYWEGKAASYSTLVDVSESGSSRKFSDLHKNALTMAAHFGKKPDDVVAAAPGKGSRPAVRR